MSLARSLPPHLDPLLLPADQTFVVSFDPFS